MQLFRKGTNFCIQPFNLLLIMNTLLFSFIPAAHCIFHYILSVLQLEILLVYLQLGAIQFLLQLGNHFLQLSLLIIGFEHVNISVKFPIVFLSLCKFGLYVGHLFNSLFVDLTDGQVTLQLLNSLLLFFDFYIKSVYLFLCLLLCQMKLIFQLFYHVVLFRTRNQLL